MRQRSATAQFARQTPLSRKERGMGQNRERKLSQRQKKGIAPLLPPPSTKRAFLKRKRSRKAMRRLRVLLFWRRKKSFANQHETYLLCTSTRGGFSGQRREGSQRHTGAFEGGFEASRTSEIASGNYARMYS